uniref:Single-stranded DNA binding protein Ssb-like OB fold domain-containing protein n=2 Tax=Brassica oleracea TaxID=3712 RepID=A0A0D3E133_BRAOL
MASNTSRTSGQTLTVKVVDRYSVPCIIRPGRIAECLVGDETASIIFTARNDQVDLMKPGTTVNLLASQRKKIVTSGDYCGMVAAVMVIRAVILERWR